MNLHFQSDFSENDEVLWILAAAALYAEEKALNEDLWNQTLSWNDFSSWRLNQEDRTFFGLLQTEWNSVAIEVKDGYEFKDNLHRLKDSREIHYRGLQVSVTPSKFLAGNWDYDITDRQSGVTPKRELSIINIYRRSILSALDASSSNALTAPMPGKIIAVNAKAGDSVKAGDPLIIMEAMKMEMTLEAPRDGVVAEVSAAVDALVTDGEMLLSLEDIEKDK